MNIAPESEWGKELTKWEQHRTRICGDEEPGNRYEFRPYPKMLYQAKKWPQGGKVMCMAVPPQPMEYANVDEFNKAVNFVETFNRSCTRIVENDDQERAAKNDGWRETPDDALARFESMERDRGDEAARRHFTDQRMSPKAQSEAAAIDAETDEHVADVPVPKLKPRGRPKKKAD